MPSVGAPVGRRDQWLGTLSICGGARVLKLSAASRSYRHIGATEHPQWNLKYGELGQGFNFMGEKFANNFIGNIYNAS